MAVTIIVSLPDTLHGREAMIKAGVPPEDFCISSCISCETTLLTTKTDVETLQSEENPLGFLCLECAKRHAPNMAINGWVDAPEGITPEEKEQVMRDLTNVPFREYTGEEFEED